MYREAVAFQSPGLLQPWDKPMLAINPERVATLTIVASGRNRVAVDSFDFCDPRVAEAATLGFGTQPLRGI